MRPIRRAWHMTMLHRIDMDVIDMSPEIVFVGNQVFPVPALPDPTFGLALAS